MTAPRSAKTIGKAIVSTTGKTTTTALAASAIVLMAGSGCRPSNDPAPTVPGPIASALLAFAAEQGTPPQVVAEAWRTVEVIAAAVSTRRDRATATETAADTLNAVVFSQMGFTREVKSAAPQYLLLPSVVSGRKGGCVGLSALYLVLAERLGVPLAPILVPGHLFVQQPGSPPRNVELLRGGEAMPDHWYRSRYGPWDAGASAYFRPLTMWELVAVHWFNVGNGYRDAGNLPAAAAAYRRAVDGFPAFAEAAANLGALDQLQGDLGAAAASYRAASQARPDLPGLARNLSLLEAERGPRGSVRPSPKHQHESGNSPRRSSP